MHECAAKFAVETETGKKRAKEAKSVSPLLPGEATDMLIRLWSLCVPCARRFFCGDNNALRLIHLNDYVLDKTFVYGILQVSSWLGKDDFKWGVHDRWPPEPPKDLVTTLSKGFVPIHLQAKLTDDLLPQDMRKGLGSSSSGGTGATPASSSTSTVPS